MSRTAFELGDIEEKTKQWGRCLAGGTGHLGNLCGDFEEADITVDEALLFDRCVLTLRACGHVRGYRLIRCHYQGLKSLREISIEMKVSYKTVKIIHAKALDFLEGAYLAATGGLAGSHAIELRELA